MAETIVRWLKADASNDSLVLLNENTASGQVGITFEYAELTHRLSAEVQAFLRENGFEADPAGGDNLWSRPHDHGARFQDRMDAEWVVLPVAEMMQIGRGAQRN